VSAARRRAAALLDNAPVVLLAAIAGAGSFTHIRDTAARHGQTGPMSWAVAVCAMACGELGTNDRSW
jgi:lysozyme family protein